MIGVFEFTVISCQTRQQAAISYCSFTATPTRKALRMFGVLSNDTYRPFHVYSMRQAIKDQTIMNVMKVGISIPLRFLEYFYIYIYTHSMCIGSLIFFLILMILNKELSDRRDVSEIRFDIF